MHRGARAKSMISSNCRRIGCCWLLWRQDTAEQLLRNKKVPVTLRHKFLIQGPLNARLTIVSELGVEDGPRGRYQADQRRLHRKKTEKRAVLRLFFERTFNARGHHFGHLRDDAIDQLDADGRIGHDVTE